MAPKTRLNGVVKSPLTISTTSSNKINKKTSGKSALGPRGTLIVGLFAGKGDGERGAKPRDFLRSTVAIGVKLEHNRLTTKKKSLTMGTNVDVINTVFDLVPVITGSKHVLTTRTLKRKCYDQDPYSSDIVYSYMGIPYKYLNGHNKTQMKNYRLHVEANGLSGLIDWLIEVVLAELQTPGSAKELVKAKVFTEYEKRALRIEIVGIEALDEKVDGELETAAVPAAVEKKLPVFKLKWPLKVETTSEAKVENKEEQIEEKTAVDILSLDAGAAVWDAASPPLTLTADINQFGHHSDFFGECGNILEQGASTSLIPLNELNTHWC